LIVSLKSNGNKFKNINTLGRFQLNNEYLRFSKGSNLVTCFFFPE